MSPHAFRRVLLLKLLRPVALCAALLLAAPLPGQQRDPQSANQGRLIIRNIAWDVVRIEVRIGRSTDCEQNPAVGVRALKRGRSWSIASARNICFRREQSPGRATPIAWTPWMRKTVPKGTSIKVTA
jgi:hypothetical protein